MNELHRPDVSESDEPLDPRLAEAIAHLAEEIAPPTDLWPEVAARLPSRRRPHVAWRWAGLAAAALLLVAVGTWWPRPGAAPGPSVETQAVVASSGPRLAAYTEGDRAMIEIRDRLMSEIEAKQDRLPPETRALVFENLRTIDRALAEIGAALDAAPGDQELGRTYIAYRERQIGLLRQANRAASRL